jgi:hypothetical protein
MNIKISINDLYKMFCYGVIYFTIKSRIIFEKIDLIPINNILMSSLLFGIIMTFVVKGKYIENMKIYNKKSKQYY